MVQPRNAAMNELRWSRVKLAGAPCGSPPGCSASPPQPSRLGGLGVPDRRPSRPCPLPVQPAANRALGGPPGEVETPGPSGRRGALARVERSARAQVPSPPRPSHFNAAVSRGSRGLETRGIDRRPSGLQATGPYAPRRSTVASTHRNRWPREHILEPCHGRDPLRLRKGVKRNAP